MVAQMALRGRTRKITESLLSSDTDSGTVKNQATNNTISY
jgi:hypothetical protein